MMNLAVFVSAAFLPIVTHATPIEAAAQFQHQVLANQNIEGKRVAGEYVTHTFGDLSVTNVAGKIIQVRFIGVLHDWDCVGTECVDSDTEKSFIDQSYPVQLRSRELLLEQGVGSSKNNLREVFPAPRSLIHSTEIKYYTEFDYLNELTPKNRNFDLAMNSQLPKYLLEQLRVTPAKVIATMREQVRLLNGSVGGFNELATDWLQTIGLNPYSLDELQGGSAIELTNGMRDRFMAQQVRESDHDLVIVAHTGHVVGLVGFLAQDLVEFNAGAYQIEESRVILGRVFESRERPEVRWVKQKHDPRSLISR